MVVGLQRQLSFGDIKSLLLVVFVPQWAGRASVLVIPVWRFSHTSALICLQSWWHACLWQILVFWDTQWAPLIYFLFAKCCCIPVSPFCTLSCCTDAAPALSCCTGGRAQWSQGGFTPSHTKLLAACGACGCPELCSGLFCLHGAKKQMQRLQGLSQPLLTSEQLWCIISMDFSFV